MKHADLIVPLKEYNENATEMLVSNLKIKMRMLTQGQNDSPGTPISQAVRQEIQKEQTQSSRVVVSSLEKQAKYRGLIQMTKDIRKGEQNSSTDYQAKANTKELSRKLVKLIKKSGVNLKSSADLIIFIPEIVSQAQVDQIQAMIQGITSPIAVTFVTSKESSEKLESVAGLTSYSLISVESTNEGDLGGFENAEAIFKKVM